MSQQNEASRMRAEVELDVFSGMPNPTWSLTDDQASILVRQLAGLKRTSARKLPGNLGYRGSIVRLNRGVGTELIRVGAGTVEITTDSTKEYAIDPARGLERWLLETGRPYLAAELLGIAQRDFR